MKASSKPMRAPTHASARRRRLASHPLLAWLTILAIAGTLCACGRYGPPKRRTPEASETGAASDSAVPPAVTTPDDDS